MKKTRSIYVLLFLITLVIFSLILQPRGNSQVLANQGVTGSITPHNSTTFNQQFTHATALVNGVRIHYVIGGSGEPVVLLHGFPLTWYHWRKVMPTLAQRYTVIAPDLRGLGDSSKPSSGYDPKTLAKDIHQLVGQLGFGRIFLVGHDWGGPVAYAYAAANRDEVQKLVILEAVIPGFGQGQQGVLPNTGQAPWHYTFHQVPDLPEALTAGRERLYISWFFNNFAYNPAAIESTAIDEYTRTYSAPGSMHAAFEMYRAAPIASGQNRESAQEKLRMPVLALGSERINRDAPLKSMQQLADNVQGGIIPRCGHFLAEECPEYLTQQLFTFFAKESEVQRSQAYLDK